MNDARIKGPGGRGFALGTGLLIMIAAAAVVVAVVLWQDDPLVLVGAALIVLLGGGTLSHLLGRARRLEHEAHENEIRYRSVVENIREVLYRLDAEGRITYFNPAWSRLTGFPLEEAIGRPFIEFVHPDDRERHLGDFKRAMAEGRPSWRTLVRGLTRDAGIIWVDARSTLEFGPDGVPVGVSGTLLDITEQRMAEEENEIRARRQEALAALGQQALEREDARALFDTAVRTVRDNLNVSFSKILRLLPEEESLVVMAGVGWHEGLVGSATVTALETSQAGYTLARGKPVVVEDLAAETRFRGAAILHDHRVVSGVTVPITLRGKPYGILGAHHDRPRSFSESDVYFLRTLAHLLSIALERAEAEEEVRRSEHRYRSLAEQASDGILLIGTGGRVEAANQRLLEMLGRPRKELIGAPAVDLLPAEELSNSPLLLDDLRAGRTVLSERRVLRRDGSTVPTETSARMLPDGRIQAVVRDITERREAEAAFREQEDQLRQARKMEALGRLAGGIAHDFNNILTAVIGFADIGLLHVRAGEPLDDYLREIKRAGERAAALTLQLLTFSRKQVLTPRVLDLNESIESMRGMLDRLIPETITIESHLAPAPLRVRADKAQLEQVILNLVLNARDSMPEGGVITLDTARDRCPPEESGAGGGEDARHGRVVFTVTDTGSGMTDEVREHAFEPFFTTKEVGQGTGLGLSTVYGIVQQGGGLISLESAPAMGTTVTVCLPLVEEPVEKEAVAPLPGGETARPVSETVLLVEDEATVRRLAREILASRGYRVLEAEHGRAALKLAAAYAGTLDILVTDVVMPSMDGPSLATALAERYPRMRVLFISGYSADDLRGEDGSTVEYLQKPFRPEDLLARVRAILDGAHSHPGRNLE